MELRSFVLCNDHGDEVCISNYGARILQWHTPVGGEDRNIVLGYSVLNEYLSDPSYHGAIVGPFANRIAKARFFIDDELHKLQANEGKNQLHGGAGSISDQYWQLVEQDEQSLTLRCQLEDNFNGYPGPIVFDVNYSLTPDSKLEINIKAQCEQTTVIGPTSHPYFNLAGMENDSAGHIIQLFADNYTAVDEYNIPTGEIVSVDGSTFDFRQPRKLRNELGTDDVDHNFIVNRPFGESQAILISPDKQLQLHVTSDLPGIQFYTGHGLSGKFKPKQGMCLEPQFFPDSPNHENFPFYLTTPEQPFNATICYQLVKPSIEPKDA